MSLPRHGSFLIPNPVTFLSLNRIRMSPTTLMGLSLTKKQLVTMSHKTLLSTGIQPSIHVRLSGYSNAPGNSQIEDYIQRPLLPPVSSSCNGEMTLLQSDNTLLIPHLINLETSGLWQSPQFASLNGDTQDSSTITAYTSPTMQLKS